MFSFATLIRPKTPNTALWADPADTRSMADRPALRFSRSPEVVRAAWDALVRSQPRTTVVSTMPIHHAVQRSRVLRFPDDIRAEARPDGAGTRVLVYSAARYGRGDLGVNARRVKLWAEALARRLADAPDPS